MYSKVVQIYTYLQALLGRAAEDRTDVTKETGGLPCGSVVRTRGFQQKGHRFDPWLGIKIPQQRSQENKNQKGHWDALGQW